MKTGHTYLIFTTPIERELRKILIHVNPVARVIDLQEVVEHYIDVYLYGEDYAAACTDPIVEIFDSLRLPTDYRAYVKRQLAEMCEIAIDRVVKNDVSADYSYMVDWHEGGMGMFEKVKLPDRYPLREAV